MTRTHRIGFLILGAALPFGPVAAQQLPLVPLPANITPVAGNKLTIANGARIAVDPGDKGAATAAKLLIERVRVDRGLALAQAQDGVIRFRRARDLPGEEAYNLAITDKGVTISASGDRGLIWGAMTLAQLLSPDAAFGKPVALSPVAIVDEPRFKWRGLMMDPVRNFQPIESFYPIIDTMAAQKLNTLHLHLTDDQGWRVEIKRYPKLTEIGAWRTPPSSGGPAGEKVGGFYTQEQLKALVAYAGERGIDVVPEIDMPGHATAAVAAYPEEVGVLGDRPGVGHDWGVNPYLFSPSERSMTFIKNVLDELIEIFPSKIIHVGGDEAVKDQWERSPAVQAQMKKLGIKTENQMQGWMIAELGKHLASRGRRLIGWDEILEGDVPTSASVMSWRGEKGAVEAANKGHDVVLSPSPDLYLDNLQSDRADEPAGRIGIQTLEKIYSYDPEPAGIDPARLKHVMGAQANAWAEYLATAKQKEHAIFPRLSAVAEFTWSPKDKRDWPAFVARLDPQMLRYRRQGIAAADSAFAVNYRLQGTRGDALRTGRVTLGLDTQTGAGTIRYTTDGRAPTAKSRAYAGPLSLKPGTVVTAAAFMPDGRATAAPRRYDASRMSLLGAVNSDLVGCAYGRQSLRVPLRAGQPEDAPAYNVNIFQTCSQWADAPLSQAKGFTIEVARPPRNFGLAHDEKDLRPYYATTEHGELIVRAGGCEGAVVGGFPLPDPATAPNRFRFQGKLDGQADGNLCFQFTSPLSDPLYAVHSVQLEDRQ